MQLWHPLAGEVPGPSTAAMAPRSSSALRLAKKKLASRGKWWTRRRGTRRAASVMAVAGISLVSPYVLAVLARRFPSSPLATFHSDLVKGEAS